MSLGVLDGAVDGAQGDRGRGRARRHGGVGPAGVVTGDVGQAELEAILGAAVGLLSGRPASG